MCIAVETVKNYKKKWERRKIALLTVIYANCLHFGKQYAKQCPCDSQMWYIWDKQTFVIPVLC